jgi:general secretion pathway protein J
MTQDVPGTTTAVNASSDDHPPHRKGGASSACGFTLVEILIAMFIFSIIVTTVFGSYRAVFGKAGIIEQSMTVGATAQTCLDRIALDLAAIHLTPDAAYTPPGTDSDPDPFRIVGETAVGSAGDFPRIRFTSREHIAIGPEPRGGVAEIVYYMVAADDEQYALMRSDRIDFDEPFEENPADPILCDAVSDFDVVYYDRDGDTQDQWDSDSDDVDYATPKAVGIELALGREPMIRRYRTTIYLPVFREPREE